MRSGRDGLETASLRHVVAQFVLYGSIRQILGTGLGFSLLLLLEGLLRTLKGDRLMTISLFSQTYGIRADTTTFKVEETNFAFLLLKLLLVSVN
jgi:hypothetical protein